MTRARGGEDARTHRPRRGVVVTGQRVRRATLAAVGVAVLALAGCADPTSVLTAQSPTVTPANPTQPDTTQPAPTPTGPTPTDTTRTDTTPTDGPTPLASTATRPRPSVPASGAAAEPDPLIPNAAPVLDLTTGCPSIDLVHRWAEIDWLVSETSDGSATVGECDYFSVPFDPTSSTMARSRYIILLSTRNASARAQLDSFRAAGEQTAGAAVAEVDIAGLPGLQLEDPAGLLCQMILQTGDASTFVILVADPAEEMTGECDIAERILTGLAGPVS